MKVRAENERESVANIYKEEYDKLVLQFNDVKPVAEHLPQFVYYLYINLYTFVLSTKV